MRFQFPDIERPKAAAKKLSRLSPDITLARAQNAIAQGSGYRDWHDLAAVQRTKSVSAPEFELGALSQLIASISDELDLDASEVQYALSKARLVGSKPWNTDDQIALHMAVLRQEVLGAPARGKPGTIVKVRAHGKVRPAYLLKPGRPTRVLYDSGEGICADFEAITPRSPLKDFLPARLWLPYGCWTLPDGSEIVFARDYLPLWRVAGGVAERVDPWLWISGWVNERWFAANTEGGWWRGQGLESALAYLETNRIFELPRLAGAMRYMFDQDVETVTDAMRRMRARAKYDAPPPAYAVHREELSRLEAFA